MPSSFDEFPINEISSCKIPSRVLTNILDKEGEMTKNVPLESNTIEFPVIEIDFKILPLSSFIISILSGYKQ